MMSEEIKNCSKCLYWKKIPTNVIFGECTLSNSLKRFESCYQGDSCSGWYGKNNKMMNLKLNIIKNDDLPKGIGVMGKIKVFPEGKPVIDGVILTFE